MIKIKKVKVYVAGPYSGGDVCINVKNAIDMGDRILEAGMHPFIPHLTHFWHMAHPHDYEIWIETDLVWLEVCDVMIRLPGESSGSDGEVRHAKGLNIPVFYNFEDLCDFVNDRKTL